MPLRRLVSPAAEAANPYNPASVGVAQHQSSPPVQTKQQRPTIAQPESSVESAWSWRASAASSSGSRESLGARDLDDGASFYLSDFSDEDDDEEEEINNFDLLRLIGGDDINDVLSFKRKGSRGSLSTTAGGPGGGGFDSLYSEPVSLYSVFSPVQQHQQHQHSPECQDSQCCWESPGAQQQHFFDGMGRFGAR